MARVPISGVGRDALPTVNAWLPGVLRRGRHGEAFAMLDLVLVILGLALFAATFAYARACEWL
jgi:hypothetical protein